MFYAIKKLKLINTPGRNKETTQIVKHIGTKSKK